MPRTIKEIEAQMRIIETEFKKLFPDFKNYDEMKNYEVFKEQNKKYEELL